VRVVGRVECRVPAGRKCFAYPGRPVLFRAAAWHRVEPRQLPDFLACIRVDDPARVELGFFAELADSVNLELGGLIENETGLLVLFARRPAECHEGASGGRLIEPCHIGRVQPLAVPADY
jgi:hypothetical protein